MNYFNLFEIQETKLIIKQNHNIKEIYINGDYITFKVIDLNLLKDIITINIKHNTLSIDFDLFLKDDNLLDEIIINNNDNLSNVIISNYDFIKNINCSLNKNLKNLSIINIRDLYKLICVNNNINNLSLQNINNIQYLDCSNNNLKNLNIQQLINLKSLKCNFNKLSSLNINNFHYLNELFINNNKFKILYLINLISLNKLSCDNNLKLSKLFIENTPNISSFNFINVPFKKIITDNSYIYNFININK